MKALYFFKKVQSSLGLGRGYVILALLGVAPLNSSFGWNKLWEHPTKNDLINTPVICRNLNNDGQVTAIFWSEIATGGTPSDPRIKILETDDNGNEVFENQTRFNWATTSNPFARVELHKIIKNPSEDGYLILGTVHNPSPNSPLVNTFVVVLDNTTAVTNVYFIEGLYHYWDIAVSELGSPKVILSGFNFPQSGLDTTTREAVVSVFDQTFAELSTYSMGVPFGTAGNINRFDVAKCLEIYNNGIDEWVVVAGQRTVDIGSSTPNYVPRQFVSKLELNSTGTLTHDWTRFLTTSNYSEALPSDILVNQNANEIVVLSNLPSNSPAQICLLSLDFFGNIIDLDGASGGIFTPFGDKFSGHKLFLLNNGNYKISGAFTIYNIFFPSFPNTITINNSYNFFELDYNITTHSFITNSQKIYLGQTVGYSGLWGTGYYGNYSNFAYQSGTITRNMGQYLIPSSATHWIDANNNDHICWSWINLPNSPNHQLRLKSTVVGLSDEPTYCDYILCDFQDNSPSQTQDTPPNPWSLISFNDGFTVNEVALNSIDLEPIDCDGAINTE